MDRIAGAAFRLIAIPTYNERQNIASVLSGVRDVLSAFGYDAEIVVFDDNSIDDTAAIALETGHAHVEESDERGGYWVNIARAIEYANRHGYRQLILMDADGQHDPKNLPSIFEALDSGRNVVIVSRFGQDSTYRMDLTKRIGRDFYRWMLRRLVDCRIADPTSGNLGFDATALALMRDMSPEMLMDSALPVWALENGLSLCEVEGRFYQSERSTMYPNIWSGLKSFVRTIRSTWKSRRLARQQLRRRPSECPLCRVVDAPRSSMLKSGYTYFRCPSCDFLYVAPAQRTAVDPLSLYGEQYYEGAGAATYYRYGDTEVVYRKQARAYLELLERWLRPGSKILELGSGYGFFIQEAGQAHAAYGIEVSENIVRRARRRGLSVYTAETLPEDAANECDAVVLIDTAEHFANFADETTKWLERVRPGGVALLEVPDAGSMAARLQGRQWRLLIPPYHLGLPNARNMGRFLDAAGFEICRICRPAKWQPISMILSLALPTAALKAIDRKLGLTSKAVCVRMPDTLLVVARRTREMSTSAAGYDEVDSAEGRCLQTSGQVTT